MVYIHDPGPNRFRVTQVVTCVTELGLRDSREAVDSGQFAPLPLLPGVSAFRVRGLLKSLGARVSDEPREW